MEPKYSVLLSNHKLENYKESIDKWLRCGIKVLWFGNYADSEFLKGRYKDFTKAFLLQCYTIDEGEPFIVTDGYDPDNRIEFVAKQCSKFNKAQYDVEHCNINDHIVVKASAGTGKTTVMIDRIMYLLHIILY